MKATIGLSIIASLLVGFVAGNLDAQKGKEKVAVRELKFKPADPTALFTIGGQSKVTRLTDTEAVEKLVGKASAKGLTDLVDFNTEAIVFVSWTSSGPPDGVLRHEVKADGTVQFYVQGPPGGGVRGQRARLGADFFAVPTQVKVSFDAKER